MNDLLMEIRSAYPSSSRFSITERDLIPPTSITGIFTAFFIALEYSPKYAYSAGELIAVLTVTLPASLIPPLTSIEHTPVFSRSFAVSKTCEILIPRSAF